ncbi:interferon-induced helicase C domain-containing protein 1 isoform X2 [Nelusetta ayraudi]|uniref:interferon-induced helicase C domain-containing protein 1 isoform X2 n=1 Tax=Nelusetta ayraudi TaxID=303726 RepID=UPI003F72D68E
MASGGDDVDERLIEYFRPRLRELITVPQVLDVLQIIGTDQKERIRQKEVTDGNQAAADLLIDAVVRKPHEAGWFQAFVDALERSGHGYAADVIQVKLPEPEVEAENDYCVKLIRLMIPSLLDMKTEVVTVHCSSKRLITEADVEIVNAETRRQGHMMGARELLSRIVRGRPGWFSEFLEVLRETEHKSLYEELTGCPPADKATDLYQGISAESAELPNSQEPPQPDGSRHAGPNEEPEDSELGLRDYQMEVAGPALQGENVIVCLPTGCGKTRVAVYITKKHLDGRKVEGRPGKVVVLVNKIPLVEQHYFKEFQPGLKQWYRVKRVSGDSVLKISFTEIVKQNDVIICTAQILENYLERSGKGEDKGVNLSDLSLVIIDECHHTQKGDVYNHIMMRYLAQKHKNLRLMKNGKQTVPLPQILALTATLGVGSATKLAKAEEHILRICANLDATKIMTRSREDFKKEQKKKVLTIEERMKDPFGDLIKKIMHVIHEHAQLQPTCELGSQKYELWVIQMERKAATEQDQKVRACADHLRKYNDGLILCNTIRMRDSFECLCRFYEEEMSKKQPDDEHVIQITETERFLFHLFRENKEKLQMLTENPDYENKSLSQLRTAVLREFSTREAARGIIFTKTRLSAIALSQWVQENPKFSDIGVKAAHVIGGGDQSVVKPMTPTEQREVLNNFRDGDVNLLVATTVAEEGLDIPECNFVIRYGHVTNEISMIQTQGRGRAEDSTYTVVDVKNSGVAEKEQVNEYRKDMMNRAMDKIKTLSEAEYGKRIMEFQLQAILEERVKNTKKTKKEIKKINPADVKFCCRSCNMDVCSGEDIEVIEAAHPVNVSERFSELFIAVQEQPLDCEVNSYFACKKCGQRWGSMMLYHSIKCPSLHVKNFVVTISGKKISKCTKWSELPVNFPALDYVELARRVVQSSDDDDDDNDNDNKD